MSDLMIKGPLEIEWIELTHSDHEHLWVMDWDKHMVYCVADNCPSRQEPE